MNYLRLCFILSASLLAGPLLAQTAGSNAADDRFLELRDAARTGNIAKANELAKRLHQYPETAYVEYYRLRSRLYDLGGGIVTDTPDEAIHAFLERWRGEAIADRLRNDWLLALGRRRDVATFEQQYPQFVLKDDVQVHCYALAFRAQRREPVLKEARLYLSEVRHFTGDGCHLLVSTLAENKELSSGDLWALMLQAVDQNVVLSARRLATLTEAPTGWEKAIKATAKDLQRYKLQNDNERKLALLTLVNLAREDALQTAERFESMAQEFSAAERSFVWGQIGESASRRALSQAHQYYKRANQAQATYAHADDVLQWQVRAALRAGDWGMVKRAIEKMNDFTARDSTWVYWLGRALKAQGQIAEADALFRRISSEFSFYGKLALEELGEAVVLPPKAAAVSAEELAPMQQNAGLKRALKFYKLDMRFEGNREWNWQMRGMSDRQLLAAAEFARREQVWDRAINAADRTRQEHDFSLRFVSPFKEVVTRKSKELNLDPSWVFGLVRQESRFILKARSHVGASGLMQLMPATARQIARQIGLRHYDHSQVDDIETNITLGTTYMRTRLDDLEGSYVLASAAYNAGIGRARQWRGTLPRPVEGAIFAETIPFSETRDYVKKVLSNAVYYAALFDNKAQSLKSRLGTIQPATNNSVQ
ncbi:MAG: transglycosylase SLT domain-containing protein [bacterium]